MIDQLTASPAFLGAFLCWFALLEGRGVSGCIDKLQRDWFTTMKAGWSCWYLTHPLGMPFASHILWGCPLGERTLAKRGIRTPEML